jgi:hypothetical protein
LKRTDSLLVEPNYVDFLAEEFSYYIGEERLELKLEIDFNGDKLVLLKMPTRESLSCFKSSF